jgi:predicted RNA-binding Zn-ribbon protein involved in translation (DUF1610 family)
VSRADLFRMHSDETVVRSTCPACGTVDVPPEAVTVLVAAEDVDPLYRYTCPQCFGIVEKPTSPRAVPMLQSAGARIVLVPAEVAERAGSLHGDVIADADVDAFLAELGTSDDLARLAAGQ